MNLQRIISGGQTGADRGALDAAISRGFPYGGAVPAGRKTESGPLPAQYLMEELDSESYPERTAKNVEDSDGTLIVFHGQLTGGSALTGRFAEESGTPCLHIDFSRCTPQEAIPVVLQWITENEIAILNIAGPRASSNKEIYQVTKDLVIALIDVVEDGHE